MTESSTALRKNTGVIGRLVRVADAGELLDLAGERLGVEALHVAAGALLEGGRHVHLDEAADVVDHLAHQFAGLGVRADRSDDDRRAVAREELRDEADAKDVGVAVLPREPEALRQVGAHHIPIQMVNEDASTLDLRPDDLGDGALARAGQAREPEGEASGVILHA